MTKQKTYIAIDLKSFYASVECKPYIYTLGMRFYSATILMTAYLHPKF